MSFSGNLGDGPPGAGRWNPDRSADRFAYRIHRVGRDISGLRLGLWLGAALGLLVLLMLIFQKLAGAGQASAIVTPPEPSPIPLISIIAVGPEEAWGVVGLTEARVYPEPDNSRPPTQRLERWTVLAFEKKTNTGWYRLLGGSGWVQARLVKTFANEQSARAAGSQGREQATNTTPMG